jgi:hypothetical protein
MPGVIEIEESTWKRCVQIHWFIWTLCSITISSLVFVGWISVTRSVVQLQKYGVSTWRMCSNNQQPTLASSHTTPGLWLVISNRHRLKRLVELIFWLVGFWSRDYNCSASHTISRHASHTKIVGELTLIVLYVRVWMHYLSQPFFTIIPNYKTRGFTEVSLWPMPWTTARHNVCLTQKKTFL